MRKLAKTVLLLLSVLVALGASVPAAADQLLPPEAYSWTRVFAGPGQYPYSSGWRLESPFQTKQGANDWKAISIPFNQPSDQPTDPERENPHRGMDFASPAIENTKIYAVAYGRIVSVTEEPNGCVTIQEQLDIAHDGTLDGVKAEYRHLYPTRQTPAVGASVTPSSFLGEVGRDGDNVVRLHYRMYGKIGTTWYETSPCWPYYDGVTAWQDGNDTSFTGQCFFYSSDMQNVHFITYGRDASGVLEPPTEVKIFHYDYRFSHWQDTWRESTMTQVSSSPPTYAFDFMDYTENGEHCYFPDGQRVLFFFRVKFGTDPNAYQWAFAPAGYERPWEDPNDWGTRTKYVYYCDMPYVPLEHYWMSQKRAEQPDMRYGWEDAELDFLYYHDIWNPTWDLDRNTTPFYSEPSPIYGLMQQYGCNACCWAMVLKNLGKQGLHDRRDFRYGDTARKLAPDPYGVTLANTQDWGQWWSMWDACWYSDWTMDWAVPPAENDPHTLPVYLYYPRVMGEYGVTSAKCRSFGVSKLTVAVLDELEDHLHVQSDDSFPASGQFYVSVQTRTDPPEVMLVTGVSDNVLTVVRGQMGTSAVPHGLPSKVYEGTEEQKAMIIYHQLMGHPGAGDGNPEGVIVRVDGHYMVFTATDPGLTEASFPHWDHARADAGFMTVPPGPVEPEMDNDVEGGTLGLLSTPYPASAYEHGFYVYDPLAPTPATGANVRYENCYSFGLPEPKRLFEIEQIVVLEPPS